MNIVNPYYIDGIDGIVAHDFEGTYLEIIDVTVLSSYCIEINCAKTVGSSRRQFVVFMTLNLPVLGITGVIRGAALLNITSPVFRVFRLRFEPL